MKAILVAASAAAIAALGAPALAQAQTTSPQIYGGLGYSQSNDNVDLGVIQGRVGARFMPNFGVEGEFGLGVKDDTVNVGGTSVDVKMKRQGAVYGVGFLPITPNTDLIARVGYGGQKVKGSALGASVSDSRESWNYGVGAQHHFDGVNGVRADYTRYDFTGGGGHSDVWSIGYTRRF